MSTTPHLDELARQGQLHPDLQLMFYAHRLGRPAAARRRPYIAHTDRQQRQQRLERNTAFHEALASAGAAGAHVDRLQRLARNTARHEDFALAGGGQLYCPSSCTLAEAGASIAQSWELNRQGSSNLAFNYGALQAGANQGAGIVVGMAG